MVSKSEKFDKILKNNFMTDYMKAINNEYDSWSNNPEECVALIMLLDQLSRNFLEIVQKRMVKMLSAYQ